jgi:hypothetical protein
MFDLDVEKSWFPFKFFTDMEKLKEKKLPRNPAMWESDLSSSVSITEAEIELCFRQFESNKCSDVGDFLKFYLVSI